MIDEGVDVAPPIPHISGIQPDTRNLTGELIAPDSIRVYVKQGGNLPSGHQLVWVIHAWTVPSERQKVK
jgi:hypothetical protein